ncbi:RNA polymerase sigma-I factor [Alkalibacillus salilacus]|uniref:RNA polymerase sigma factor SigI n=1 Tax=Alkalibacillus salilacus TaxID=284582 RepID=A0ABT9VG14_9BACI|nr:RNA polymerase sigma-I factor [Alkalibacillus salilacus]MDQ0159896.1 RNA polymerase sigma factor [Alkalibacillus salilacus]
MLQRLKKTEDVPLEEQVLSVQHGDEETRHHLLSSYQPFIAKCVSNVCKRYINQEQDDEFSIGLMAFNEAMDTYSRDKGSSFLTFAKLVISRKVIDFIRQQTDHFHSVSLDQVEEDDESQTAEWRVSQVSKDEYAKTQDNWYRQIEIEEYNERLKEFKLSFAELADLSPKHVDARQSAQDVARYVYEDEALRHYVLDKKRLPIKQIEPHVSVSKKTIERNRKYILAVFVLLCEDFTYLKEYVQGVS